MGKGKEFGLRKGVVVAIAVAVDDKGKEFGLTDYIAFIITLLLFVVLF